MKNRAIRFVVVTSFVGCLRSTSIATVPPDAESRRQGIWFVSLTAGGRHTCAVTTEAAVYCWGHGRSTPRRISGVPEAAACDAGHFNTCASTPDGSLYCWSEGPSGNQPHRALGFTSVPTRIPNLVNVRTFSSGFLHTCAVDARSVVVCWGGYRFPFELTRSFPSRGEDVRALELDHDVRALAAGVNFVCMAYSDGRVGCAGDGVRRAFFGGDGPTYADVPSLGGVIALSTKLQYVCGFDRAGLVRCWGTLGSRADGSTSRGLQVETIPLPAPATQVSVGGFHACALLQNESVWCWGDNSYGQSGMGSTATSSSPVRANVSGRIRHVATGFYHTCVLLNGGSVECWGRGDEGALGVVGVSTRQQSPVQVQVHEE